MRGIFRTDPRARACYSEGAGIYRIVPAAVAVPADVADLQALVQWAAEWRACRSCPRGAGSAMGGGNVGAGVVVDLTALAPSGASRSTPPTRTARTSAGVTHGELDRGREPTRSPPPARSLEQRDG